MWKLAGNVEHIVVHQTASGRSSSLEIEYRVDAETITTASPRPGGRGSQPEQAAPTQQSPLEQRLIAASESSQAQLPDADLYLVACVKRKTGVAMSARELYASPWFQKARACV